MSNENEMRALARDTLAAIARRPFTAPFLP